MKKPCGVITDNLLGVDATTPDGERRLAIHYQRGIEAGCWVKGLKPVSLQADLRRRKFRGK